MIAFSGFDVLDPELPVALGQLGEQLRPNRPPAADVRVVRRDVLDAVRRPVGHEHDGARVMSTALRGALVNEPDQPAEIVGVGLREHAVAEVEDVPGPPAGAREHVERRRLDALPGPEQHRGIEVPLHRRSGARGEPALVERDAPVEADRVAAGGGHRREQVGGAGAEVDRRHVDGREHARRIGRDELLVVGDREGADPGVEELDRVCAGRRLRRDVAAERVGQPVEQRVPDRRLAVHQLLRLERSRGSASPRRGSRRR